jgi:hypothetical protein
MIGLQDGCGWFNTLTGQGYRYFNGEWIECGEFMRLLLQS